MKLYYSPGACSMASHIVLEETGLKYEIVPVNLKDKTFAGGNYLRVSPLGYVPAIETQTGENLTEGAAILQYLGDRVPEKDLVPRWGTAERYRLQEMLNFIATEVHKGMSPLFNPQTPDEVKKGIVSRLSTRFDFLANKLQSSPFLLGQTFTVADAYLFTTLTWTSRLGIDLAKWPALANYVSRLRERPTVRKAMQAEGL